MVSLSTSFRIDLLHESTVESRYREPISYPGKAHFIEVVLLYHYSSQLFEDHRLHLLT